MMIRKKIREMLAEDIGFADMTSEALVPEGAEAKAEIIAKQRGVVAGVAEAAITFDEVGVRAKVVKKDGQRVRSGDVLMRVEGPTRGILAAERTALNLLMRMSGVATATREMVERARKVSPNIIIAATRKTMPLWSYFDKRAIRVGGGDPHRFRLDDCVVAKDNHVRLIGSIEEAVRRAREASFSKKVEIEVSKPKDALEAARVGADIVMLDNMKPADVKRAVKLITKAGLRRDVMLEASGGIDPSNVGSYAASGVDVISSSYMTLRASALDMSLEIHKGKGLKSSSAKHR
jgi:nicotinate-nucleotide pyrophosphorylase (carboxylating)